MLVTRKSYPRAATYPLVGMLLALGAPGGLLLLRWGLAGMPGGGWWGDQLSEDWVTYSYLTLSTTLAFALFGMVLGRTADRLVHASRTDPLTRLSNRRHFCERLSLEIRRARRYGSPLSLLMVDVDGLKRINDEQGHDAGDAALKVVAAALSNHCRATDLAARWGGDEFAVLAPGIGSNEAQKLADRIRQEVRRHGPPEAPVAASVGVAAYEQLAEPTAEALTAAADAALYLAKTRGRDRTVVFQPRADPAPPSSAQVSRQQT